MSSFEELDALRERLEFIGLDQKALAELAATRPVVEKHLPEALSKVYTLLSTVPAMAAFFYCKAQMGRAKTKQLGHWASIAAGSFDETYLASSPRWASGMRDRARAALVHRGLWQDHRAPHHRRYRRYAEGRGGATRAVRQEGDRTGCCSRCRGRSMRW